MNKKSYAYRAGTLLLTVLSVMFLSTIAMTFLLQDETNLLKTYVLNAVFISVLSLALPVVIFTRKAKPPEFNIRRIDFRRALLSVCVGIGLFFLATAINTLCFELFNITGANTAIIQTPIPTINNVWAFIIAMLVICVIPAIAEELLFRGALLYSWKELGRKRVVLITSILFALIHFITPSIPALLIIGAALGFIAFDSRSVLPCIIIHFTNNLISLLFSLIDTGADTAQLPPWVLPLSIVVFLILGGTLFFIAYRALKKANDVALKSDLFVKTENSADQTEPININLPLDAASFPKFAVIAAIVIMSLMNILNTISMYIL